MKRFWGIKGLPKNRVRQKCIVDFTILTNVSNLMNVLTRCPIIALRTRFRYKLQAKKTVRLNICNEISKFLSVEINVLKSRGVLGYLLLKRLVN